MNNQLNIQLYEEIYNLILKYKEREDIPYYLQNAIDYIQTKYFYYFKIQYYDVLSLIKDIVWYNLEFLPNDNPFGLHTLDTMGTKFNIISQLDNNVILNCENVLKLKDELTTIINKWNNNWKVVKLYSDVGINSNKVIIYNKNESPRKYGYYKKSLIVDKNNNNIFSNKDVILCEVNSILGEFYFNNIIYNTIVNLYNACKECNNKYIIIKTE